jgi:hypothetical protein
MKLHFTVELLKFEIIEELENGWNTDDYRALLVAAEYGDTSEIADEELKEMSLIALSDYEPEEAAKIVLTYIFAGTLNAGQVNNLANEMLDEKMWEEYADLSLHEQFFSVSQLLYQAFKGKFPHPEAVRCRVKIDAEEKAGYAIFEKDTETALLRILVQGMPPNTLISRLFEDQVSEGEFREAKDIIWQFKEEVEDDALIFELISSEYWLRDLKYAEPFEAVLTQAET